MAYDADPSATHNPAAGGTPTAAWGDIINANFAAIGGAWTAFTPSWTGSGSNPSIGNGVLTGKYVQLGKTLHFRVYLQYGSTSTAGSGTWRFGLPNSLSGATTQQICSAFVFDAGARYYVARGLVGAVSYVTLVTDDANAVTNNQPITWASGDEVNIQGTIEVA